MIKSLHMEALTKLLAKMPAGARARTAKTNFSKVKQQSP